MFALVRPLLSNLVLQYYMFSQTLMPELACNAVGGQVIIMDIWKERASGPLHLIHLGFGAGGFLLPQIMAPFISDKLPKLEADESGDHCSQGTESSQLNASLGIANQTTVAPVPSDTLQFGFIIVSGIIVAISLIWFGYGFFDRKKEAYMQKSDSVTIKEIFNLNTCAPGHPAYAFLLYALMFVWIYVAVAGERVFAKYLYSYARKESCWSKTEAANLLTAFWVSFTAGRFTGFVSANFIHMKYIIFVEGIGNAISAIVLFFFSSNRYVLWVCVCASGLLIGPCYPSGLAWANRYMIVTATGVTILSTGAGISDISFLFTIGYFIKELGIQVMMSFVLGFGVLVCVMPALMMGTACQRGDRFEREANAEEKLQGSANTAYTSKTAFNLF